MSSQKKAMRCLNESTAAAIAASFIQLNTPGIKVGFSSTTYCDADHHFEPLRGHWLVFFDLIESGEIVSSTGIVIRVDDQTGEPFYAP